MSRKSKAKSILSTDGSELGVVMEVMNEEVVEVKSEDDFSSEEVHIPVSSDEVEMSQDEIERENRVVDIESEIVKLTERLTELKKEHRMLTKPASTKGQSKMDMCVELYKSNEKMARKDLVKLFMEQAGLTLAGSRTYAQLIMSRDRNGQL